MLEKRKNCASEGLEIEAANLGIEEKNLKSSGNLWKDLDERYRNEKQLLVKWLQVSQIFVMKGLCTSEVVRLILTWECLKIVLY